MKNNHDILVNSDIIFEQFKHKTNFKLVTDKTVHIFIKITV